MKTKKSFRVIQKGIAVIGSTTIDKIVHPNASKFKMGGVTTYSGITYRRHGIKTRVVTNVAKCDRKMIKRLERESIVVCNGSTEITTCFENIIDDEDKRSQKILRQAAAISGDQVIENLKHVDCVHLGPLYPTDIDVRTIELIDRLQHFVILDVQGLVRIVQDKIVYQAVSKYLPKAMRVAHIVKANRLEYESIIAFFATGLLELMRQFKIHEFIVTAGHKGGHVRTINGEKISYPAVKAAFNEDPTGAGDTFLAAYVIGRFLNQQSVADACQYAAQLAALQIEGNYIKPDDICLEDCKRLEL